jgi:hypothetical protein
MPTEAHVRLLVSAALAGIEIETKRLEASADDVVSAGATLCSLMFEGALQAGTNPAIIRAAAETILMRTAHAPQGRAN